MSRREIEEWGTAQDKVVFTLPGSNRWGTPLTYVVLRDLGRFQAWDHRPDLLAERMRGRWVLFNWKRYEGGFLRYIDGPVWSPPLLPGQPLKANLTRNLWEHPEVCGLEEHYVVHERKK